MVLNNLVPSLGSTFFCETEWPCRYGFAYSWMKFTLCAPQFLGSSVVGFGGVFLILSRICNDTLKSTFSTEKRMKRDATLLKTKALNQKSPQHLKAPEKYAFCRKRSKRSYSNHPFFRRKIRWFQGGYIHLGL